MKIGLLGGTYDPIHIGHILLGRWAQEEYALDEVWFLPAGSPYFMGKRETAEAEERLRMCELALSDQERMQVCDIELRREGNTYTCDTISELNRLYPEDQFYFIIGADCLQGLGNWREPETILRGCSLIAATRGSGCDKELLRQQADALTEKYGGEVLLMDFPAFDISSTLIRERVKAGKSVHFLEPDAVEEYIRKKGMYR